MTGILVIAPAWIGDAVLAQPLFMRLHERHRSLALDVLAPPWTHAIFSRMPEVRAALDSPFGHGVLALKRRWALARELAAQHYAQAIVLPNSFKSALIPCFAGIPRRTGFVGEARWGLLNDARRLEAKAVPQMAERFALLAENPGAPVRRPLPVPRLASDASLAAAAAGRLGLSLQRPVAVLCPGAEYGPAKRWLPGHFAALARKLAGAGLDVWLAGSERDAALGAEIALGSGNACLNLCGRTTLAEAIDLISLATLVVSNDSGLMHVAAALDRPLIALYGSSSPAFTPPLSARARIVSLGVPCSPCYARVCPLGHFDCMTRLTPDEVWRHIELPGRPSS